MVKLKELYDKVVLIQKHWRGYVARKKLKKMNASFATFQRKYRARRAAKEKAQEVKLAKDELKFQLILKHRRMQRLRKVQLFELIDILPSNQIVPFMEKQREYSATIIQACFRGYMQRKKYQRMIEQRRVIKAVVCIQRAVKT